MDEDQKTENPVRVPLESDNQATTVVPCHSVGSVGVAVDDYIVLGVIGRGGYGEVRLIQDRNGTYWAVKTVYRGSFPEDRPYEREYQGILKFEPVSRLAKNQLQILHVGRRDEAGYFYYIMELADDENTGRNINPETYSPKTLKSELQKRGRLSFAECLPIARALTEALHSLHHHDLVHRDIKLSNIIFVNGTPKLADIGLVATKDVTLSCVGTEGYIPPEGPGTAGADIYGLGKVLYESWTGHDRFNFPTLPVNIEESPDHQQLLELNAVVTKACEQDPRKRYQSAAEMGADLQLLAEGKSVRRKRAYSRMLVPSLIAVASATVISIALYFLLPANRTAIRDLPHAARLSLNQTVWRESGFPVPAQRDLMEAEKELKEIYQTRLTNASVTEKQRIADEMLDMSATLRDPTRLFACLSTARDLGMEAGDIFIGLGACSRLGDRFRLDPYQVNEMKADVLCKSAGAITSRKGQTDLLNYCLDLGFECLRIDDFESASRVSAAAAAAVGSVGDGRDASRSELLRGKLQRGQVWYARIAKHVEKLNIRPDDPLANSECGKYLCCVKDEWDKGLPLLVRGSNGEIREAAKRDLQGPTSVASQIAQGDAWWAVALKAPKVEQWYFQQRAAFWYRKGLDKETDAPSRESLRQKLRPRLEQ